VIADQLPQYLSLLCSIHPKCICFKHLMLDRWKAHLRPLSTSMTSLAVPTHCTRVDAVLIAGNGFCNCPELPVPLQTSCVTPQLDAGCRETSSCTVICMSAHPCDLYTYLNLCSNFMQPRKSTNYSAGSHTCIKCNVVIPVNQGAASCSYMKKTEKLCAGTSDEAQSSRTAPRSAGGL
jgi:hypothetical protein